MLDSVAGKAIHSKTTKSTVKIKGYVVLDVGRQLVAGGARLQPQTSLQVRQRM